MKNLLIAFLLLLALNASAATKTVVANGGQGWGTAANWSPSGVPVDGDEVIINAGQTISIKGSFYTGVETIIIKVYGTLDFNPSGKLDLGINSQVQLLTSSASLTSSGTGSEIIKIGGVTKFDGSVDGMMLTGPLYANKYTTSSPSGFSSSATLPVKLLSFAATIKNADIGVSWQTAEEINTTLFVLERAINGAYYEEIGRVYAKGSGSSYQVSTPKGLHGNYYYRLKTIDRDGRVEYSKIISINQNGRQLYAVVPNPAKQNIIIQNGATGAAKAVVQIFDVAGTRIYQHQYLTGVSITIDVSTFKRGVYFIRVNDQTDRIVLQ